jgi:hypothetical protein
MVEGVQFPGTVGAVWQRLRGDFPTQNHHVEREAVYAIPESLLDAIAREIPRVLAREELRFSLELSRTAGVGFSRLWDQLLNALRLSQLRRQQPGAECLELVFRPPRADSRLLIRNLPTLFTSFPFGAIAVAEDWRRPFPLVRYRCCSSQSAISTSIAGASSC